MRLTNVSQMDLVSGRLRSYAVRAAGLEGRALPVSFDQGRHVGDGQRPGSWMALALRMTGPVDGDQLAAAWDAVVARHGTLHSVFSRGPGGEVQLHDAAVTSGEWREHEVAPGRHPREVVREVFDAACAPFERPSHCLCLIEPPAGAEDPRPALVIGSDHAHVDMWSLLILAHDLVRGLADVRAGRAPGAELPPVASFAEHTAALEQLPPAPEAVERGWAKVMQDGGGTMPVFPLPLGDLSPPPAEVVEVRDVLDVAAAVRFAAAARERGTRPIALAISVLVEVTGRLSGQPLRAVFPVHSRNEPRWRDAVGWFITNAVLDASDADPAACAQAVNEAIQLGSWPLAPLLAPYGGMPSPPGMFAVSWLDTRRLPVPTDEVAELRYVSAAIRTDGVMLWFMVNEDGLHLRCRYPDTPQARANVGRWLDAVEQGLQAAAAPGLAV